MIFEQSLLELKTQCDHFLTESFNDNKLCKETIIGDFEHIFNLSSNSPEYLSLYIDNKLKKGIKGVSSLHLKQVWPFLASVCPTGLFRVCVCVCYQLTEQEVESFLDKALMLFKFLNDKDLFERYYRKHLSSRLLSINSMPDNTEQSMILRFRVSSCSMYVKLSLLQLILPPERPLHLFFLSLTDRMWSSVHLKAGKDV